MSSIERYAHDLSWPRKDFIERTLLGFAKDCKVAADILVTYRRGRADADTVRHNVAAVHHGWAAETAPPCEARGLREHVAANKDGPGGDEEGGAPEEADPEGARYRFPGYRVAGEVEPGLELVGEQVGVKGSG